LARKRAHGYEELHPTVAPTPQTTVPGTQYYIIIITPKSQQQEENFRIFVVKGDEEESKGRMGSAPHEPLLQ
jgi:hypothetical protein